MDMYHSGMKGVIERVRRPQGNTYISLRIALMDQRELKLAGIKTRLSSVASRHPKFNIIYILKEDN